MSQEQLREVEAAREQARLAAQKFEAIRQAQQAEHGELPRTPTGRPPEAVRHRAFTPEQLQRKPEAEVKPTARSKPPRIVKIRERRPSKRGFFRRPRIFGGPGIILRQKLVGIRLKEGTPANISRAEKEKALRRLDEAIAKWSRKYTFRVVHGGTPHEKNEAAIRLRELHAEREAIEAMKPLGLPEHIRRAERFGL